MMNDLQNIEKALALASRYVQGTWQQVVMGALPLPGVSEIRANVNLRKMYADSIVLGEQVNIPEAGFCRALVVALKKIAADLEFGRGPWDMKPMLLNGPKARISKKGIAYNIIPFRHAVPGGTKNTAVGRVMPKDIYKQARAMKASVEGKGMTVWGGKLTGTEHKYGPGKNPTTGAPHKAGKFEGMVRIEKTYERATQNKYMTFRVVSEKSDPGSWYHPGYPAYHIADQVKNYCRPHVEAVIEQAAKDDLISIGNLSVGMSLVRA